MKNIALLIGLIIFSIGLTAPASAASGEKLFKKCKICHSLEEGKNKIGPSLYDLIGRSAGTLEGYKFSKALKNNGFEWTEPLLNAWLRNPKDLVPKTKMRTRGIKKEEDRLALIEYLREATKPKE